MLEGQVAALSSQAVSPEEALTILKALPDSPLYCHVAAVTSFIRISNSPSFLR